MAGSESEDESSEAEELQLEEARKAALSRAKLLPKKTADLVLAVERVMMMYVNVIGVGRGACGW